MPSDDLESYPGAVGRDLLHEPEAFANALRYWAGQDKVRLKLVAALRRVADDLDHGPAE